MYHEGFKSKFEYKVTKEMMKEYGELFDDFAYLHYNDGFAGMVGFGKRIVQGSLIGCLISRCIAITFGDSTVLVSRFIHYLKPIYPEQKLIIVLEVKKNLKKSLITVNNNVYVNNELRYKGYTKIKIFNEIRDSFFHDQNYDIDL